VSERIGLMMRQFFIAIVIYLPGCAPSGPELMSRPLTSGVVARAEGCWQLQVIGLGRAVPPHFAVRLLSEPADTILDSPWLSLRLMAPMDSASRWRISQWGVLRNHTDRVRMSLGDGLTGVAFQLQVFAGSMRGVAHTWMDTPGPSRKGRVIAVRDSTACG
jgi:hypothetical protein